VPLAVLGMPIEMLLPLFLVGNVYQFLQHTELVGRLGVVDRMLMTPSNHRVHHGRNALYLDRNYGNILLLWDHVFGTWQPETEPVAYGTLSGLESYDPVDNNLAPVRALVAKARGMATWRDTLLCFVMPPEWKAGTAEFKVPGLPRVGAERRRRIAIALVASGLAGSLWITWLAETSATTIAGLSTLVLLGALAVAGLLLDGRGLIRPAQWTMRSVLASGVLTVAGASTNGPLALLGARLEGRHS